VFLLQFLRGLFIAKVLGPYFFGIWGFIKLIQQYLSYMGFGIQYSLNVELSTKKKKNASTVGNLIGNSILRTSFISAMVITVGIIIKLKSIDIFSSYSFSKFIIYVVLIASFNLMLQVFTNVYRSYGHLFRIAMMELLLATATLSCVFIFKDLELIYGLLGTMLLTAVISIGVFITKFPFPINICFNLKTAKSLISAGLLLQVWNVSYYLIIVSSQTIISIFYSVEEMGYFSLAFSITIASLLGLRAATWVLFPQFLWKLREEITIQEAKITVNKITKIYSSFVYLITLGAIMLSPILYIFLDKFEPTESALNYLLLSQAILSGCFAYNSLAIARKKQAKVAKISVATVVLVIVMGLAIVFLSFGFSIIALSVTIGTLFYSVMQTRLGESLIGKNINLFESFKKILPPNFFIPILVVLIGNLLKYSRIAGIIGFIIYVVYNFNNLKYSLNQLKIFFLKSQIDRMHAVSDLRN